MKLEYTKEGRLHWHVLLGQFWWNYKTIFGVIGKIISWPFRSKDDREMQKRILDVLKK